MTSLANPKVHNVRFYKPKPKAVYCMAIQPHENKLALSRSDASVEIWNLTHAPFIERTIASSTENFSIEGLAWCGCRLFSVGLHGLLIEYDLYKLEVKSRAVVTGEAAFCLDINKQKSRIAIGTEQGYLNIFQIHEEEVLFEKFLDKQEGRILCLKFDHSGEFIVSGSLDTIRIWSVSTNQALHRMVTGRSEHNKPTIVWCLAVTKDFTILSGDSRGILSVWDGKMGAQLESYQSHRADILSIALSDDEASLYCAGVDPNVQNYVRVKVKDDSQKWVRSIQRKIHDHDIRALVLKGEKLYSSGVDGYLACSYHPPKTLLKYPPILQNPCVVVAPRARHVLLRFPKYVEIWTLGESGPDRDPTGVYDVRETPKKLVLLQKVTKIDEGEHRKEGITCATISPDGTLILYSTRLGIRLLKLTCEASPKLMPIEVVDEIGETPCISAIFTSDNQLILAPNSGGLQVISFDNDRAVVTQNIDTKKECEDAITLLAAAGSAEFLVAADVGGNIAVWNLQDGLYVFRCKLPKYKLCPTAMAIHPVTNELVVAYSNGSLIEYDLTLRELTPFSRHLSKNPQRRLKSRNSATRNITFDPNNKLLILLHDDDGIIAISKEMHSQVKSSKSKKEKREFQDEELAVRFIKKHKHLVHLEFLSPAELVAVEVNPLSLTEQLPPCLVQNTFGRK